MRNDQVNRCKMGVAILISSFVLMACGKGFKPIKATATKGGAGLRTEDAGSWIINQNNFNQSLDTILSPKQVGEMANTSQGLADRDTKNIVNNADSIANTRNQAYANSLKSVEVFMEGTKGNFLRRVITNIATGCTVATSQVASRAGGATIVKEAVDLSYLKEGNPHKKIELGFAQGYALQFTCHDSDCKSANLLIRKTTANNGSVEAIAVVLLVAVGNTGRYVPGNTSRTANNTIYAKNLKSLSAFNKECKAAGPANDGGQSSIDETQGDPPSGSSLDDFFNNDPFAGNGLFNNDSSDGQDPNLGPGVIGDFEGLTP